MTVADPVMWNDLKAQRVHSHSIHSIAENIPAEV